MKQLRLKTSEERRRLENNDKGLAKGDTARL